MSLSRKWTAEDLEQLDAATHPVDTANFEGNITLLSPVKKGRRSSYFEGEIDDGTCKLRLVGFSSDHRRKLNKFFPNKGAVSLQNCQIKEAREGHKMEVLIKTSTQIHPSSKKFNVTDDAEDDHRTTINLSELIITQNFQRVYIDVKVVKKSNVTYVAGNKRKQDVIIADNTGRAKLTLWEQNIDALTPDSSYSLQNFVVREYEGRKFLSMPRDGAEIIPLPDVGPIDTESDSDSEREVLETFNVQVTGVPQLDSYKACLGCKARVEPSSPSLGRCSKCAMLQRFDICPEQMLAKLVVMSLARPRGPVKQLHALGKIVQDLAEREDTDSITQNALLTSRPVEHISFNERNVITAFSRNT